MAMTLALTPGYYFQRLSGRSPAVTLDERCSLSYRSHKPEFQVQRDKGQGTCIPGFLLPGSPLGSEQNGGRKPVSRSVMSLSFTVKCQLEAVRVTFPAKKCGNRSGLNPLERQNVYRKQTVKRSKLCPKCISEQVRELRAPHSYTEELLRERGPCHTHPQAMDLSCGPRAIFMDLRYPEGLEESVGDTFSL